ncbi:hypothetical protein GCM10009555_042490 [Acrocarpospora macrocephala]|uniref:Lipoprotein n=1 Tax=Acrocarpospora macrocephala TaxID=150177 RepID=A0A5M3WY38_9ACTN|nr:hypothetical protein Amac_072670 [Acrocarpospora macrocephala]
MNRPGRRTALLTAGLAFFLSACQIGRDALFIVTNDTTETVVVTWNGMEYATLPPGRSKQISLSSEVCTATSPPADDLRAVSARGKHYAYGRRACNGETWRVGSTPVSPPPS